MQLQSKYLTTVIANGTNLGSFSTFSGGEVTSEAVPDRSPGAEFPSKAGGEKDISDITVSRRMLITRDTADLRRLLRGVVGVTDAMTVGNKELDANGAPFGKGDTYIGTLTSMGPPESDINSTGEPSMLTLVIAPSSVA